MEIKHMDIQKEAGYIDLDVGLENAFVRVWSNGLDSLVDKDGMMLNRAHEQFDASAKWYSENFGKIRAFVREHKKTRLLVATGVFKHF